MMTFAIHVPTGQPCLVIDQEFHHQYDREGRRIIGRYATMLVEFMGHAKRTVPAEEVEIVKFKSKEYEFRPSREFKAWQGNRRQAA
jgi:hypothetical protein